MSERQRHRSGRPSPGETADYAQADLAYVVGDDAVEVLRHQQEATVALFSALDERAIRGLAYAPGKWTVKEVLGHLADDERIFAYRALCLARGDARPLPGFDENLYMLDAGFEARPLADLIGEYVAVRRASIALFAGLPASAWPRRGEVNGYPASVRGLAFHIAGHELHHHRILAERYLVLLRR